MKVFVVTYGCYSSMYVAGVFSDKQKADLYASADDDGLVEEHELDEHKGVSKMTIFTVDIDREGNERGSASMEVATDRPRTSYAHPDGKWFSGTGESYDIALKMAGERRHSWLREKAGTPACP